MKFKGAFLYLIIAAVIWGATVPIMKITLREVPVFSLIFLRMSLTSLILLAFIYKRLKVEKTDYKNLFWSAVFGTNLNLAFFFFGLKYSLAVNGSVLLATTPIFTLIFAHIYLREKISAKLTAGALLAFLGIVTIVGIPAFQLDTLSTIGNLSLLASALAWVGHEIFAKKVLSKYPATVSAFFTTAIGAILFSPLFLLEFVIYPGWYLNVSREGLLGLSYGTIFASLIAYTVWQKGLSLTTASEASFVFYLLPITGIIFSIILLGEKFSPLLIVGSVLVLAGIILAEYHRRTHVATRS